MSTDLLTDADQISDIAFGFMGSKALFAALDVGLFTALADGAKTAEEVAVETGLHPARAETLLTALAGLGLLSVAEGRFANAPAATDFLVAGARYDFGDYLRLQVDKQMYRLLGQLTPALTGTLRKDATDSYETWFSDAEEARLYSESQHAGSTGPARQLARRLDLEGARRMLDVGGGTGAFAIGLCQANPDLQVTILDFPNVAKLGRDYIAAAGLSDRIGYQTGNALEAEWPGGVDAVLMSYLFSGVPGDAHAALLAKAMAVLTPGGRVMVHDFIVHADRTGPRLAALWQLQHTAFTPEARSTDTAGLTRELEDAGFEDVEIAPMIPEMTMLAVARKPR
ncbi:Ubiquinone/menaquinone biosynthesis C-methylase UbiE [Roseivivax lentus]|uniref:Ubiquinone/menaquinone biosynthesis C-methylase UbiE n=1 Tax=Roseivivax lentus TaxID=633194 RepID=A0A1N7N281_9RHOB|nr:methyltransferase [Roseivivax lentus]SIS92440.1 Ubiquinone/menaquinone biosynthesis C-methylase UbiE [Roseivivax lentus]